MRTAAAALACLASCTAAAPADGASKLNLRPIIGILTNPNQNPDFPAPTSYASAGYVKWLEAAGARVVPLAWDLPLPVLAKQLEYINGALFMGGGNDIVNPDGSWNAFGLAGQLIFNTSVQRAAHGEVWPLWGTCQGHESLLAYGANTWGVLSHDYDAENLTLPLNYTTHAKGSILLGSMPSEVYEALGSLPITMNNHEGGIRPDAFAKTPGLADRFYPLATNVDRGGRPFVSVIEGSKAGLPIYGTQFHPEKVGYEWNPAQAMVHTLPSVVANQWFSYVFVNQARQNLRTFPSVAAESAALIYNYNATYAGKPGLQDHSFEQIYFFGPGGAPW